MVKNNVKKTALDVLRARIQNPKTRFVGIEQLRSIVHQSQILQAYQFIFPYKASLQDYHGVAFPKSASQPFSIRSYKKPTSALREILWALARCIQFSEEIKEFNRIRELYENAIINNDYAEAIKCLNAVEERFGKSIWLYQNLLASAHISSDQNEPSQVANRVMSEIGGNPVLHPLMHYIRARIEGATLPEKIRAELDAHNMPTSYANYFKAKILDVTDSDEARVSSLLYFDSQSSLIDHYASFILSLQAAISDAMLTGEMSGWLLPGLNRLYLKTADKRMAGIIRSLGGQLAIDHEGSTDRELAIEAYTAEDYERCVALAGVALEKDPLDSSIRMLMLKSAATIGARLPSTIGICGDLHDNLYNILSVNQDFFRSAHALMVAADRFIDHNWMLYLRVAVWHEIGSEEPSRIQSWTRDMYVRDRYESPFLALNLERKAAQSLIENLEASKKYTQTLSLVKNIVDNSPIDISRISAREARYRARELLSGGSYEAAATYYRLAASQEKRAALKMRSLGGASLSLMLNGKMSDAIETFGEAFLENSHAPILLPFKKLVEGLPEASQWPNTICLGLLLNLSRQMDEDGDLSKLRLAFEQFCIHHGIYSPSALADRKDEFGENKIIAYLDQVWQPEVMRQTLIFFTPEQIDESRIEACQVLAKLDAVNIRTHREELASRIKQQEIAKSTALVEQSKVYVDIEAIKRALKIKLKNSYAQYKSALVQHGKPKSEMLQMFQKMFDEIDSNTSMPTLLSKVHFLSGHESLTQSDIQFNALFGEITKEFLTGDHGLNAYLSTRVRHGKFVDALRKSVSDEHLVTARLSSGVYVTNQFWRSNLYWHPKKDEITEILEKFSRYFDEILFATRDKRIQIHTYMDLKPIDENSEGLFKYQFSHLERRLMQSYDVDFKDFDELIVKCVDSLWEKTDYSLENVRNYLSKILKSNIIELFDGLATDLSSVCDGVMPSMLSNSIARARTATQQALDNVVTWFHRSEVYDRQDFDIDLPCQIAASMVSRTLSVPQDWEGPSIKTGNRDFKLPGRALDGLVDIFYALFENAVKYAELHEIELNIDVHIEYKDGGFRGEVLSKADEPSEEQLKNLSQLKASLSTQESRRLAQSEGRSGFRKILLALSNPLYKSNMLDFQHEQSGIFRVNFEFTMSELS